MEEFGNIKEERLKPFGNSKKYTDGGALRPGHDDGD
jgi:hypothetical protein